METRLRPDQEVEGSQRTATVAWSKRAYCRSEAAGNPALARTHRRVSSMDCFCHLMLNMILGNIDMDQIVEYNAFYMHQRRS